MEWEATLARWQSTYGCSVFRPASRAMIAEARRRLGPLPAILSSLYENTTGLVLEWL